MEARQWPNSLRWVGSNHTGREGAFSAEVEVATRSATSMVDA